MKRFLGFLIALALVMGGPGLFVEGASAAPEKAMCLVCQVTHGEAEEEAVKATRVYEGKEYGFCSEKCAKAFAEDPIAYLPPTFPRPVPAFALKDFAGKPLSPATLKGQVVLVDFWATWCVPCRKSMPELQAIHEKYKTRGFSVLGISIDEGDPGKVRKYADSKKITYPIAVDSDKSPAWEAFRVKAIPAAYLVDREGRIVAQWTGVPVQGGSLETKIQELLAASSAKAESRD